MAFSLSLFNPRAIVEEAHGGEFNDGTNNVIACVPLRGYTAALAVNACLLPILLCFSSSTCRRSLFKTLVFYGLMLYNLVLASFLVKDANQPVGACLLAYILILMVAWLIDRIRFCFMLRSLKPLIDMRSNFVRVSTCLTSVVVPVNHNKPWFLRNFDQHCCCSSCFYVHSATYIECTFITRFSKTTLVSVSDFQLNGSHSTVFLPVTRDSVPLHIIAPSVLTV